jgi:uncharacterized membrane protein
MVVFVVYMVSEDVKKRILDAVLDKQVNFFWVWGFILLFSLFFVLSVGVWIGFKFNRAIHF